MLEFGVKPFSILNLQQQLVWSPDPGAKVFEIELQHQTVLEVKTWGSIRFGL